MLRRLLAALLGALSVVVANAATLDISGGILTGADDVQVGTGLYHVDFIGGTCASVFSGCNSPANFVFSTQSNALAASQAVLDQVLHTPAGAPFDATPTLMAGCFGPDGCGVLTPYSVAGVGFVNATAFENFRTGYLPDDVISYTPITANGVTDWAQFTQTGTVAPIPEPSTYAMLLAGLFVLGFAVRRNRENAPAFAA